ncbi:peptidylprolyl isomerase [Leptolyngbya sp. FACHB-711]|uniref:peptidylprolyl isomerase n=1 Tax=unclassified Leptolyngbya TaxID=2650499 RepID=UPI001683DF0E|nr:peptidylprolyl isomerase [Leptolyngbya sp. FACHB-711]MBD1852423.1 peptidylprolyl isomerase [Cyanobacteria bacterium FACHB-502]MBD2024261.1 peptidylprolyl isomerase [Leptolyngbya sp. FACHB-711]
MSRTLAPLKTLIERPSSQCGKGFAFISRLLKTGISLVLLIGLLWSSGIILPPGSLFGLEWNQSALALPPGNAITDGKALLRYALPIDNKPVRDLQVSLESMSEALRGRRKVSAINRNLDTADRILNIKRDPLLASVPDEHKAEAEAAIDRLKAGVADIRSAVEKQDKEAIWTKRGQLLDQVGQLEELMVAQFPYEVPEEYSNLPQLKGRATVEVQTTKGDMTLVVDGYNAPITAGNFVDLVQRGFYNGLEFVRAEDFYVAQIGDPPGKEEGFVDPKTGKYRAVPLEIMVQGDKEPTYGVTLEEAGRYLDQPVLPFSAYGTLGMARPGEDNNGGSSQFFFFLFEPELTPAGLNLLDGRYAVFGYVTENKEVLDKIRAGDKIVSARVVKGAENLVEPESA